MEPFGQRTAAVAPRVQPFRVMMVLRNTVPASLDAFVNENAVAAALEPHVQLVGGATVDVPSGTH